MRGKIWIALFGQFHFSFLFNRAWNCSLALEIFSSWQPKLIKKSEIIINSHHPLEREVLKILRCELNKCLTAAHLETSKIWFILFFKKNERRWWSNNWILLSISPPVILQFFKCLNIFKFLLFIDNHSSWHLKFSKWSGKNFKM